MVQRTKRPVPSFAALIGAIILAVAPLGASGSRALLANNDKSKQVGERGWDGTEALFSTTKISDPYVIIENRTARLRDNAFLASPSIIKLDGGKLLTMFEVQPGSRGRSRRIKELRISKDGGKTWTEAGKVGPMQWPTLFKASGSVYALGVERHFSSNNNVVISKMLDKDGWKWTEPVKITEGISAVTANGGIDVSQGLVTKAIEVVPANNAYVHQPRASLTQDLQVDFSINMPSFSEWVSQHGGPRLTEVTAMVEPASTKNMIVGEVLKVELAKTSEKAFFKLVGVDAGRGSLRLRPEAYNMIFQSGLVTFPAGSRVEAAAPNSTEYGSTSWGSMVLQAPETADLLDPAVWSQSNIVSSPANLHPSALAVIFGISAPLSDMKALLSPEESKRLVSSVGRSRFQSVRGNLGFGSTFLMEGTPVRLQDSRGGDGSIQVLLRVNNDMNCNFGALVNVKDYQTAPLHLGWRSRQPKPPGLKGLVSRNASGEAQEEALPFSGPEAEFMRFAYAPGISIAHAAILFDPAADVYWYVNNLPRDSLRIWGKGRVYVNQHTACEADRTTLGLYYSSNAVDWVLAGIIDYAEEFHQHFTYPHMLIDGDDLLIVTRATLPGAPRPFNNHSSNAIVMHRVRDFRRHAYLDWVKNMDMEEVSKKGPLRWKQGVEQEDL